MSTDILVCLLFSLALVAVGVFGFFRAKSVVDQHFNAALVVVGSAFALVSAASAL